MSLALDSASTQYLLNTAPSVTTLPITVGVWLAIAATGTTRTAWSLANSGSTTNFYEIRKNTSDVIQWGDSTSAGTMGLALTVGTWSFVLCRWVANNERRGAIFQPYASTIYTTQSNTSSNTMTGINRQAIGLRASSAMSQPWDGFIAEYWMTSGDIYQSGSVTPQSLAIQLALGGPFSVPHVASKLVEYRSFRQGTDSATDKIGEVYSGGWGRQTWTTTNGASLGPHPPLPYWYERPGQVRRILTI